MLLHHFPATRHTGRCHQLDLRAPGLKSANYCSFSAIPVVRSESKRNKGHQHMFCTLVQKGLLSGAFLIHGSLLALS